MKRSLRDDLEKRLGQWRTSEEPFDHFHNQLGQIQSDPMHSHTFASNRDYRAPFHSRQWKSMRSYSLSVNGNTRMTKSP